MSNFFLRDPDCIFIHIPKTGGSTIRRGLWGSRYDEPVFGKLADDWPSVYSFAFVRHPLDRFVSAFSDFTQIRNFNATIEEFAEIVFDHSIKYDETRSMRRERIRHHCIPQTHPFNCLYLAQDIYRFENFQDEVERLGAKLGCKFHELPHRRKTEHGDWRSHIDQDLTTKLIRFYDQDFETLGYDYP